MNSENIFLALKNIKKTIDINKDEIEKLDQAIGDGDHIFNIQRGLNEALKLETELSSLSPEEVFKKIGMKIMTTVGGILWSIIRNIINGYGQKIF